MGEGRWCVEIVDSIVSWTEFRKMGRGEGVEARWNSVERRSWRGVESLLPTKGERERRGGGATQHDRGWRGTMDKEWIVEAVVEEEERWGRKGERRRGGGSVSACTPRNR